jgi:uncharacterized membrane-anchored protein
MLETATNRGLDRRRSEPPSREERFDITITCLELGGVPPRRLFTALAVQLAARAYVPWRYWIVVVLLSIFGTLVTDNLVDNFGVPLTTTTTIFGVALLATFVGWYVSERTLSIHSIRKMRRELWYWAAILFTFALGTAAGDLVAEGFSLGYLTATLIFGGIIAAVTLAHLFARLNAIWAFWLAYIVTRPFGASFGDLMSQPVNAGGMGLGTIGTSAIFLATILCVHGGDKPGQWIVGGVPMRAV